jgi:cation diffusion facilitator CzcD-associated flavoprotein CzcO
VTDVDERVVIVGAGFAGVGLAIQLEQAGFSDFAIFDRADSIGGTWRDNTYPGCACDVPSHLYSYSFAPNPDWSRAYGRQEEILAYLRAVAEEHGVTQRVRFGIEMREANWDEDAGRWVLDTNQGRITTKVLVSATGPFGSPALPDIPGLDRFAGTSFHSLNWDHDHALRGERLAVIGTGASAVQFVPKIQPEVQRLLVFQRTPPWIMPRFDRRTSTFERRLMRRFPALREGLRNGLYWMIEGLGLVIFVDQRFAKLYEAAGRWQLRRQVADPELRAKLTPDYRIGCKRAILSDAYLPALTKPNVDVITDTITEVREHSIVTADGSEHPVDTIVYGTGFHIPHDGAARVRGRDGRSVLEIYRERPQSYLGTCISGFPNFFMFLGPFGAAGNQSALYMLEAQMSYIVDALRTMRTRGAATVEVREEVQDEFVTLAERRSVSTVWLTGGCRSYYQTPDGRNSGLWPDWSFEFQRRTKRFDADAYTLSAA